MFPGYYALSSLLLEISYFQLVVVADACNSSASDVEAEGTKVQSSSDKYGD